MHTVQTPRAFFCLFLKIFLFRGYILGCESRVSSEDNLNTTYRKG